MLSFLIDLCIRLRHRYALRLGAWCCRRALARMEHKGCEAFEAEAPCAPVFEQLLMAKLRAPR